MLLVSNLLLAPHYRETCCGTHFRTDYPSQNSQLLKRNIFEQNDLVDYLDKKFKKPSDSGRTVI